jgi:hypothetical protein
MSEDGHRYIQNTDVVDHEEECGVFGCGDQLSQTIVTNKRKRLWD